MKGSQDIRNLDSLATMEDPITKGISTWDPNQDMKLACFGRNLITPTDQLSCYWQRTKPRYILVLHSGNLPWHICCPDIGSNSGGRRITKNIYTCLGKALTCLLTINPSWTSVKESPCEANKITSPSHLTLLKILASKYSRT